MLRNKTLPADQDKTLHPRMTVIYGPNEAGKSTWHAAFTWGLCGRPLPRGRKKEADDFAKRYRPWHGDAWGVSVELELAEGRRVRVSQDFADPGRSEAIDLNLGARDVSRQVIAKGDRVPDGSRWLGLDRNSFRAVASVEQAQILAVRENAKHLESVLQQAASSLGGDVAAADAIARLERCLSERVGREAKNVTRPLQRAKMAAEQARAALQEAKGRYAELAELAEAVEEARWCTEAARVKCAVLEAGAALAALRKAEQTLQAAQELARECPAGEPPDPAPEQERLRQVEHALQRWRERPDPIDLGDRSSEQIRAEINALPPVPKEDREVHPDVQRAWEEYHKAQSALALLGDAPDVPPRPLGAPVRPEELERLAGILEERAPELDQELHQRLSHLRRELASMPKPWPRAAIAVVLALGFAVAAGLWAADLTLPAFVAAALTAGVVAWALARGDATRRLRLLEEIGALERQTADAEARCRVVEERRAAAAQRLQELGVEVEAASVRACAAELRSWERERERRQEWEQRRAEAEARLLDAEARLIAALRARGEFVPEGTSAGAAWQGYQDACRRRAVVAAQAERRPDLERELSAREELEHRARETEFLRQEAAEGLRKAARRVELPEQGSEEDTAAGLEQWMERERNRLSTLVRSRLAWEKLQGLLAGRSMADLEAEVEEARRRWEEWRGKIDLEQAERAAGRADLMDLLQEASRERDSLARRLAEREGRLREAESRLPDVAALEEELQAAENEEARVRALKEVLETTLEILREAEEEVHRDIAPKIEAEVSRHLLSVTGGRYKAAKVDPETLAVKVECEDGQMREAELLSHGTAEQVYLLLRVALARLLCGNNERCPLLLDDPTVQSDADRTVAILEVLRRISREHQVVLFTQEEEVRAWAAAQQGNGVDLIVLEAPPASPVRQEGEAA